MRGLQTTPTTGTNLISGTLSLAKPADNAFASASTGQGILLIIGNGSGTAQTQATVSDNTNDMPNNMITVINSTGTMLIGTTNGTAGNGDAVGNFILNGGTWQQVSQNVEC